jgi:hypothetical protein
MGQNDAAMAKGEVVVSSCGHCPFFAMKERCFCVWSQLSVQEMGPNPPNETCPLVSKLGKIRLADGIVVAPGGST